MLINLKVNAQEGTTKKICTKISERIPTYIEGPCLVDCDFSVQSMDSYYLLTLQVQADLIITCQRCLHDFAYHYSNKTDLAACHSEAQADALMSEYECVVVKNDQLDLTEILTDELYLYSPNVHPKLTDCDQELEKFIQN